MNLRKKPIVIVGSGFAGINAALNLKKFNLNIPIIIADSQSSFIFKPLLYEALSGEIKSWEVAPDLEAIFSNSGVTFLNNELCEVDFCKNILKFKDNLEIEYEYLVLSTGSSHNSFSIKGVDEFCYFFNDINDLNKLKVFLDKESNSLTKENLFIIGAGPSGIELACKLSDLYAHKFNIQIIEKSREILSKNKVFNREEAEKALKKRDIKILFNTTVDEISENEIQIIDQSCKKNKLVHSGIIWTAGVKPNLPRIKNDVFKSFGKLVINEYLQMKEFNNVFALGDISTLEGAEPLPKTAQVAMQQGKHAASNLNLLINKKELLPFEFKDNGEMISLGLGEASISALGITLSGKFAFELRRLIYASKMPIFEKSFKSAASWLIDKKSFFSKIIINS
tara:strand:- start:4337 stop:5521 length:1185 start_codon:yes stop_codon:yes gene_type:complete